MMDMSQPQNIWGVIIAALFLANTIVQVWSSFQIRKIEIATNSMKDALVLTTKNEAILVGADQERKRAAVEAAAIAKAKLADDEEKKE